MSNDQREGVKADQSNSAMSVDETAVITYVRPDPDAERASSSSDAEPATKRGSRAIGTTTGKVRVSSDGKRRATRKARLRIAKVDPWSVMKTALMFSFAIGILSIVAVALLWGVIEASGAIGQLQETINALLGNADGSGTIQVSAIIDRWRVLGFTAVVAGINVVLLTALATLGAFLYNLASGLLGGLEVTLAED